LPKILGWKVFSVLVAIQALQQACLVKVITTARQEEGLDPEQLGC
jgi:hypothetical protein